MPGGMVTFNRCPLTDYLARLAHRALDLRLELSTELRAMVCDELVGSVARRLGSVELLRLGAPRADLLRIALGALIMRLFSSSERRVEPVIRIDCAFPARRAADAAG